MAYRVEFTPHAARALRRLPTDIQRRLGPAIDELAESPRPPGVEKLSGTEDTYRIRIGNYRVLYEVHDERLYVLVIDMGHRREIYRR